MDFSKVLQNVISATLVVLFAAFVGVGQSSAQSNTYYVDGNGPGNNSFNGSQLAVGTFPAGPWATITYALTQVDDGDTIVVLAGDYSGEAVINTVNGESITFTALNSGGNVQVIVEGFTADTAGDTYTLAQSGTGVWVTDGDADDVTLTAGNVNVTGALTIGSGGTITRTAGTLTGTAPTTTNVNVTYDGDLGSNISAGNELPSTLGTGTLTISHDTGELLTIPNNVTAAVFAATDDGSFTFTNTLTTTGAASWSALTTGGTATFGNINIQGGLTTDALSTMNISVSGSATIDGGDATFNGNATHSFASMDITDNALVTPAGVTVTVSGVLTIGDAAAGTRINNDATLTVGSITVQPTADTGADEVDKIMIIDNGSGGTLQVNGAITEGVLNETVGVGAAENEYNAVSLVNADASTIRIGASSTIRGDINNAEEDGVNGPDNQGIRLDNDATLTVSLDEAGGTNVTGEGFGDFVGGTLVIDYAEGAEDATDADGTDLELTTANNVTFTGSIVAAGEATTLDILGNLTIQEETHVWAGALQVDGTLTATANGQDFNGGASSFGGIDFGSTTGHDFAGAVTVTGTTANVSNTVFQGAFTGGTTAVVVANGADFQAAITGASLDVTGATQITGALDTSGNVVINAGASLDQHSPGATSDIDGSLTINGTYDFDTAAGDITVDGDVTINTTTGTLSSTGVQMDFTFGGNFTGGTFTDGGADDTFTFNVPSGGSTIAPKPGTTVAALTINGSGRTATFSESINVAGNVTVGNDVTVALGANSIVMTAAGSFTLTDEAQVTNSGTDGSVQFTGGAAQTIDVTGTPSTTPQLHNIVVNNTAGAPALDINNPINITGTLSVLDGVVRADNAAVTFTGATAKIAYKADSADPIAVNGTGSFTGTRDLEYIGGAGAGGAEYTATGIRNLTVSSTGAITLPATAATISGNLLVSSTAGGSLTQAEDLTVTGNATFNNGATGGAGHDLSIAGVLTVADGVSVAGAGARSIILTGNSQTHSLVGILGANTTLQISGTGTVINGSIAAGDADADSELLNLLVDASKDVTMNSIQDIDGTVTVNGTATINMVSDGATGVDTDGQIAGAVDVNNGGSLTVSSNDATTTFTTTVAVNDGGTFTLGSSLGAAGVTTVGDGTQATAATFDLNGNTFTAAGAAGSLTVNASTGAAAPSFGSSGTVNVLAGGGVLGATNPTIPNLTVNGGAATEIDSDVTVTGTFTVAAASNGADGDNVTLSGSGAIGQFNADYTAATLGAAGSAIITTGTTIQSNVGGVVNISNLNVATTGTTSLATNHATSTANNFRVNFLNHDSGTLDINGQTLTILGDNAGGTMWDHDGGSYAATNGGAIVIDDDGDAAAGGGQEIVADLTGAVSVPNLTIVDAATGGLQLSASDALTVTGTFTVGGGAGNVDTENGANDATLTIADGATIVRSSGGVTDHFDNDPALGQNLTVRYTFTGGSTTTGDELPTTLARLEVEGAAAADDLTLEDGVALTVSYLEVGGELSIDEDDDGNNSITITDGGTLEIDSDNGVFEDQSGGTDQVPSFGTTATMFFNNATVTAGATVWPTALTGTGVTLTVHGTDGGGGADTVTLNSARTVGAVTVGDGTTSGTNGTAVLATGANTLTASSITVNSDGTLTGVVNVSGAITNSGALTANVTSQADVTLTGTTAATNPGSLTLNGSAAQTLTVPAAGAMLTAFVVNNAAGVTVSGGNLGVGSQTVGTAVTAVASGLTLTSGTLNMGGNTLILPHGGSGLQGFTRTNGCVFGDVRKALSNTTNTAPADRMEFPLCTIGGIYRPYAITFNNPNTIGGLAPNAMGTTAAAATGSSAPALTVRHDRSGENGVAVIAGTNGLNTTVNGVNIARYPTLPNFFWTVSPNFTMSPSLTYDLDMRANDYANFSASCGTAACDINEIFPIRRHVGSDNNLWAVSSSNLNNFLAGADDPVVVATGATGTLQTSGTIFTYGLKSIFAASGSIATVTTTTGNTHDIDANSLFTGFQGNVQNVSVAGGGTNASATVAGTTITVTGGADAGSTTLTVTAEDSFGTSATASQPVDNSTALAGTAPADRTINLNNTFDVDMTTVFAGGAGTAAYGVASDNGNATVTLAGNTATVTGAVAGASVITLTATDQSSTPVVVNVTFNVTVNTSVTAGALGNQTVVDGSTVTQDVSATFSGGTVAGAYTITASVPPGDETIATVVSPVVGNSVEVTGASPYVITGTTVADAPPVTITVTATDDLGESAPATYTVDVTPVQGDVDGDGDADIFDAVAVLDFAVGIGAPTAGTKQFGAADWNSNGTIQSFDAFAIFNATTTPKTQKEIAENVVADLAWGEVTRNEVAVELPVTITGDINATVAAQLWTKIDPEVAKVTGVTFLVEDAIASAYHVTEEGDLSLAVIGGYMPADGIMATISLELFDSAAEFEIAARGAVNNNAAADIDDLEVLELPEAFALLGNYPNPFNPSTNIQFDLPAASEVSIEVYDMLGRRVMVVPAQTIQAGAKRSLQINASALASGSYFYRVIAKAESSVMVDSGRMLLVK